MAVTAIVRFTLPEGKTHEEMAAAFERSAPLYRDVPGLVRKYYLVSDDVRTGGGVYLFESRADAERLYDDAWRAGLRERLGVEPTIEYFDLARHRRQRGRGDFHRVLDRPAIRALTLARLEGRARCPDMPVRVPPNGIIARSREVICSGANALTLYIVFLVLGVGGRIALQYRLTGDHGLRWVRRSASKTAKCACVLLITSFIAIFIISCHRG